MNALVVAEMVVGTFRQRLQPFGIIVAKLTGDHQLTKQQTQIIITTPTISSFV